MEVACWRSIILSNLLVHCFFLELLATAFVWSISMIKMEKNKALPRCFCFFFSRSLFFPSPKLSFVVVWFVHGHKDWVTASAALWIIAFDSHSLSLCRDTYVVLPCPCVIAICGQRAYHHSSCAAAAIARHSKKQNKQWQIFWFEPFEIAGILRNKTNCQFILDSSSTTI